MRNKTAILPLFFTISTILAGCSESIPKTAEEKQSYAAGVRLAETFHKNSLNLDHRMVNQAVKDVLSGKKLKLNEAELKSAQIAHAENVQKARFAEAGNNLKNTEKQIETYLKNPGVKRTDSGLMYRLLRKGNGARPIDTDTVTVDYTGKLVDGLVFDSSVQRGKPAQFQLKGLIPGLREAFKLMNVGSKMEVMIPPQLGYGTSENANIPSNAALVFELELKSIEK